MRISSLYHFFFSFLLLFLGNAAPLWASGAGTASDPFTTLDDAARVRTPGIYHFSLSSTGLWFLSTTFSTYVDGNGYVLIAIDFGHNSGSIPEKSDLDTTSRGILPSNALRALDGIEQLRISSTSTSAGGIDVITTDSTLISRVQDGDTLKIGRSDNAINQSWTGLNAQYITDDATCDKPDTGLENRIIHQCGNGSGFHWVSEQNIHKITWGSGEIDSSDSLRLWVHGSISSNGSTSNLPPTDISLSNNTVDENQPAGTVVGTFSTTDPDNPNETFIYTLVNSNAYPGNNYFTIDGDTLKTDAAFDYEAQSSYQINIQVEDSAGHTKEKTFNIQINNLPENTTTCHGCDCSLDDDTQNSTSPGITIPALDHATSDVSTCLSGISEDADSIGKKDYYNFIVDVDGEFNLTATSPTNDYFHLEIKINGAEVYPDTVDDSHSFHTNLSAGDQVIFYFKESGSDLDEYEAHLVFTTNTPPDFTCSHPHQFTTRYNEYVPGDLVAIGNSNICADVDPNNSSRHGDGICDANQRRRNDTTNVIHINKWSSTNSDITGLPDAQAATLLNVTNAELKLPPGAKVKWAGLYWQGEVWNFKKGAITNQYGNDSGDDGEAMMAKEMEVSFMRPNDNRFSTLKADELYWFNLYRKQKWGGTGQSWGYGYGQHFGYSREHYFLYHNIMRYEHHYQGFKDVTKLLQEVETQTGSANGKYWVGNIQATVGLLGYPGVEAAWTLQVVYDLPTAQPRVITVTDGYLGLYSSASQGDDYVDDVNQNTNANCQRGAANTGVYAYDVSFDINNILTPKTKPDFATDMTVFATESDPDSDCASDTLPEQLTITRKDGSIYVVDGNPANLPGANPRETCDAWHYSITKKNGTDNLDRSPNDIYPIGMTLRNYHMTDALSTDQNKTRITFKTDTDRLILGVIGFATDLKAPELCYDYDVRIGDYIKIPSTDRHFETQKWGDENLQLKILIRSKEADFDFEDARMWVTFSPDNVFDYQSNQSEISPEGINQYLPAKELDSAKGVITIGHDYDNPQGGTLGPNESTYVKQKFKFKNNKNSFDGSFEIYVEGNVSYIPNEPPIGYRLSTAIPEGENGHIGPCPTNPTYDPIWGQFNIENTSNDSDANKRYPLYTQVAGRPYEINIVSYTKDANDHYTVKNPLNATVEMEIIDVSPFDNNASAGYDSTCQEPVAASKGYFVKFNNQDTRTVSSSSFLDQNDTRLVLRNAAFRIWYLTKKSPNSNDRELVIHDCNLSSDSSCFDTLYANVYKNGEDNTTKYCANQCENSSGTTCYDCLRVYFARPVCSRDNFSIRPEGFRINLFDTDEKNTTPPTNSNLLVNNITTNQETNLSAGYNYLIKVGATAYGNSQVPYNSTTQNAKEYYTRFTIPQTVTPLPANTTAVSLIDFNGNNACTDQNNSAVQLVFHKSTTPSDTPSFMGPNAGHYTFWMIDNDWTQVDQIRYQYKKTFDPACTPGSTNTDQCSECLVDKGTVPATGTVGCAIRSDINSNTNYNKISFLFLPYRFDTSGVQLNFIPQTPNHYLFMNDFSRTYYDDPVTNPIDMGAIFDGNITAVGKNNKHLTNFTKSCVATDLRLNIDVGDFNGTMQEYLQHTDELSNYIQKESSVNNTEVNLTLPAEAFADGADGAAYVRISTTLHKPIRKDIASAKDGINPIKLLYKKLTASGDHAPSHADTATDPSHTHIPSGQSDYNRSVLFVYGKITPWKRFYDVVQKDEEKTPIYIDVYCDRGDTICANEYNLTDKSQGDNEGSSEWYWLKNRFALPSGGNGLGSTDLVTSIVSSRAVPSYVAADSQSGPRIDDIPFEDDASRNDVNVSVASNTYRPVIVKVHYEPVPWLIYDPASGSYLGSDYYRVRFTGGGTWAGPGLTGHVIETNSSNEGKTRMNW